MSAGRAARVKGRRGLWRKVYARVPADTRLDGLAPSPVALLVLLPRPAGTRIVPPDLGHRRGRPGRPGRASCSTAGAAPRDRRRRRHPGRRAHEEVVGPLVGAAGAGSAAGGGRRAAARRGGSGRSALTWILRNRSVNVDWMSCMRSSNISKASRLYSTSGSFWPQARYWIAFRSWSRSYRWSFQRSSSTLSITCESTCAVDVGDADRARRTPRGTRSSGGSSPRPRALAASTICSMRRASPRRR